MLRGKQLGAALLFLQAPLVEGSLSATPLLGFVTTPSLSIQSHTPSISKRIPICALPLSHQTFSRPAIFSLRPSASSSVLRMSSQASGENVVLTCEKGKVGQLIGTKGSVIKRLQQESGARISIDGDASPCTVTISGSPEAVEAGKAAVNAIINPETPKQSSSPGKAGDNVVLTCEKGKVGQLIGPKGSVIKRLQQESGAHISIDGDASPCTVTISGSPEAVEAGKAAVNAIINPKTTELPCPPGKVAQVIGPGGVMIREIQEKTGARVNVDGTTILISGPDEAVAAAKKAVESITNPLVLEIPCPKDVLGPLIGDDGENLASVRAVCTTLVQDAAGKDAAAGVVAPFVNINPNSGSGGAETMMIQVETNSNQKALEQCGKYIRAEIQVFVEAQDYEGEEGKKLRAEANKWALERSAKMQASQEAYASGDGAAAKALADEGKAAGEKMKAANAAASEVIFKRRNEGKGDLFIDLHGLQLEESLGFLRSRLQLHLSNDVNDQLEVVTGAGNHSVGEPKIKPAVFALVKEMGLKVDVKNAGSYIVHC